ncbi:MAG: tetratricopeptide repeat protein [Gammaproteobacteria bacterium]
MRIPLSHFGVALLLFLGACSSQRSSTGADDLDPGAREETPLAGDASEATYHAMLGEIALQREMYDAAVEEFRLAAELSTDPELIERATSVAFAYEHYDDARVCGRRWLLIEPQNYSAHRFLALIEIRSGDVDAALPHLRVLRDAYSAHGAAPDLGMLAVLMQEDDHKAATEAMEALVREKETAEGRYAVGALALRSGQLKLARTNSGRALQLRPDWDVAGMLHARTLVASGEIEKGIEQGAQVAAGTDDPAVQLDYGGMLAGLGRYREALLQFEAVREEGSRESDAVRAIALVSLQLRDFDAARRFFGELVTSGFYDEGYYYLGRIARSESIFDDAEVYYRSVEPSEYFLAAQIEIADVYLQRGDLEGGRQHLHELARAFPDYEVPALAAEADLLAESGENDAALALYAQGIAEHAGASELRYGHAFLLERLGRSDEALAELRAIVADYPDDAIALNALGYTLADRGQNLREAQKLIKRALEIDPTNAAILDSMGWVLYRRGRGGEAAKYLRRARVLSRDPEIAAHLSEVLLSIGERSEALEVFESARREYPDSDVIEAVSAQFDS